MCSVSYIAACLPFYIRSTYICNVVGAHRAGEFGKKHYYSKCLVCRAQTGPRVRACSLLCVCVFVLLLRIMWMCNICTSYAREQERVRSVCSGKCILHGRVVDRVMSTPVTDEWFEKPAENFECF